MSSNTTGTSRREFLTKAAYVAPAILTLPAVLSVASAGTGHAGGGGGGGNASPSTPGSGGGSFANGGSGGGGSHRHHHSCEWWEFPFFCLF